MIKVTKNPCKYKIKIVQTIIDHSPDGESYTDTYYKCLLLGRRIKKRECIKCKNKIYKTYFSDED